jgi:arsenite methyltransferase
MKTLTHAEQLKQIVKEKYSEVAEGRAPDGCCGSACGCSTGTASDISMADDYSHVPGYIADADLGLGCGLPTEFAHIDEGDIVLDLGSGAGNDAFVARLLTGKSGKVIGVDMTEKMIARARVNAEKLGYHNVEFRLGDIEELPVTDSTIDVIVSNCVLNLVPDKAKAFEEAFRVLKNGGHISVSDIVLKGTLPAALRNSAELYAGCVAGALEKEQYLGIVKDAGFINITVQKEKRISIADELLVAHLQPEEIDEYRSGQNGIYSITVYAEKAGEKKQPKNESGKTCCDPGCCN